MKVVCLFLHLHRTSFSNWKEKKFLYLVCVTRTIKYTKAEQEFASRKATHRNFYLMSAVFFYSSINGNIVFKTCFFIHFLFTLRDSHVQFVVAWSFVGTSHIIDTERIRDKIVAYRKLFDRWAFCFTTSFLTFFKGFKVVSIVHASTEGKHLALFSDFVVVVTYKRSPARSCELRETTENSWRRV